MGAVWLQTRIAFLSLGSSLTMKVDILTLTLVYCGLSSEIIGINMCKRKDLKQNVPPDIMAENKQGKFIPLASNLKPNAVKERIIHYSTIQYNNWAGMVMGTKGWGPGLDKRQCSSRKKE